MGPLKLASSPFRPRNAARGRQDRGRNVAVSLDWRTSGGHDVIPVTGQLSRLRVVTGLYRRTGAVLAVPVGSTEQHGPHLPLPTDTEIATALCVRLGG